MDVPSGTSIDFELIATLAFLASSANFSASCAVVGIGFWFAAVVCRLQESTKHVQFCIAELPKAARKLGLAESLACPRRDSILRFNRKPVSNNSSVFDFIK